MRLDNLNDPPWSLKEALLALIAVFAVNNLLALMLRWVGFNLSPFAFFTFASILQTSGIIAIVFYFVLARHHAGGKSLGLKSREIGRYLLTGLGGGVLIFLVVVLSGLAVERLFPAPAELQPFAQLVVNAKTWTQLAVLLVLGVILAPVGEELYFRGFLYPALRSRLGVPLSLLLSGGFFGIMHFDLLRFLPLALGGVGLAWLYERTGSLYTAIAAHSFWNFVMLALLLLSRGNPG